MDEEKLSMFDGDDEAAAGGAAEQQPEPEAVEAPEPEEAPVEASQEPETGEKEQVEPPSPEPEDKEQRFIPIATLLDERDKRQKAEREAEEARRWRAERERQEAEAAANAEPPDYFDDPQAAVRAQVNSAIFGQSRFFAEREFGADKVAEAFEFFNTRPRVESEAFLSHPSPYHAMMEAYGRHQVLAEVGEDPTKWRESERARLREEILAEINAKPPTPPKPPGSLATAPSAGRQEPEPTVNAPPSLEGLFNG